MIVGIHHPAYREKRAKMGFCRFNGAYYYAKEIEENIIPHVETDRNWVLLNLKGHCYDHSIVFAHQNILTNVYEWLKDYKDLVIVVGVKSSINKLKKYGKVIYLPLSINVKELDIYKKLIKKDRDVAYAGRKAKLGYEGVNIPKCDHITDVNRDQMLTQMARYHNIYAVGRTAIEAKALGCNVLPYDPRYPDPSIWQVVDNSEAADILNKKLKEIDNAKRKGNQNT